MSDESNTARRLRRHLTRRRALVGAVVALGIVATVGAPLIANAGDLPARLRALQGADASVPAASETESSNDGTETDDDAHAGTVEVHIAPVVGATIDPASPTVLQVEIRNDTDATVGAGVVRLSRSAAPSLTSSAALDAWLSPDQGGAQLVELAEASSPMLLPGASTTVSFPLPEGFLGDAAAAPVAGFAAEVDAVADGTKIAEGQSAFALTSAAAGGPRLALVGAITAPVESTGLIDAETLGMLTGPVGHLTRQLDALADRPVAVGLDPRIIASIRALGTSAPESAIEWLARLRTISNEVFPLAYADADLTAQTQLGFAPASPTTFADVLDPADFLTVPGGSDDSEPTPSPGPASLAKQHTAGTEASDPIATEPPAEPTIAPGGVPTTAQLLAWPYTRADLAWPAVGTVSPGDLAALRAAGYTTTILDASNVEPINGQPNAAAAVEGESAVVADSDLSSALRAAATATSDAAWGEASGRLSAELALRAAAGERSTLLATFPREPDVQPGRVGATLAALDTWPWSSAASLADAVGAPPTDRVLVDGRQGDGRLGSIGRLFESESSLASFATVLDDPALLTASARRSLLALLDVAWLDDPDAWSTAVGGQLTAWNDTRSAITVAPSSQVNVLSAGANFPTTVENLLPYPANVVVHATPSNGRLVIEEDVTVTVPADSRTNVLVPVKAGVSNGKVVLTVTLSSPTGVAIGQPVQIPANVQADWEGVGATILAVVLVLFFGIGVWRNIRRRRRQRAEAAEQAEDADEADGSSAPDEATAPDAEASEASEASEGVPDADLEAEGPND